MLSPKPWRTDSLVRLFASVLICFFFLSTIGLSALQFFSSQPHHHTAAFLGFNLVALVSLGGALAVLSRPWQQEKFIPTLAVFLGCVYVSIFCLWLAGRTQAGVGSPEVKNTTAKIVMAILTFQGAALALVHIFLRGHQTGWSDGFGLRNNPRKAALLGIAAAFCAVPMAGGLQYLCGFLMKSIGLPVEEQDAVQLLRATQGFWPRAILGFAAVVIAPVAEEVLFRGLLYPTIKQAGFSRVALWASSFLFAAIHLNLATFIPLMALAMLLVWLYEKTDNLLAPMTAHAFFNAANFVMLFTVDSLGKH